MLTKFILHYNNFQDHYELRPDDLKNWDEVKCCYKRSGYSGIIRSFTSKFEFCNGAYDIIMGLFDKYGFAAHARIDMMVMNDRWEYVCEFTAELDFATLTFNHTVLTLYSVDNSIAAVIKANRSTKFEFVVGEDIPVCGSYIFDRLRVIENVKYSITQGESQEDGSLIGTYKTDQNQRLYVGRTAFEIAVGKVLLTNEDQTNDVDGCLFKAMKSAQISFDAHIVVGLEGGCAPLTLMKNNNPIYYLSHNVVANKRYLPGIASWNSITAVEQYMQEHNAKIDDLEIGTWVVVNGIVWQIGHDMVGNRWDSTNIEEKDWVSVPFTAHHTFTIGPGDIVWLKFDSQNERNYQILSSNLEFSWTARGTEVKIDAIRPLDLLEAIVSRFKGSMPDVGISEYDPRLNNTLILASESVRAIEGAKIYASFNDFCEWMETVFGYTYEIDETAFGMLIFKHRKEIFKADGPIILIPSAVNVNYAVEKTVLYSAVTIGYNKIDYEGVNGRDEFNFSNTYQTGFTVTDKTLELKSPFRADSYGLEFNVQKRGEDTTDNSSDKNVFFVLGHFSDGEYRTMRSKRVEGAISETMINGEFSPMACVGANRDYISIMSKNMELTFASSDANSNIIVGDVKMSDDLVINDCEMLTAGELKFSCEDIDIPSDLNSLIKVPTEDYIYSGYIKEVTRRYANPEAIEMTIMIKDKTPC